MDRDWLETRMAELGLTYHAMRKEFGFSPDNLKAWESGGPARAFTLRKLARILQVEFKALVANLGVVPTVGESVPPTRRKIRRRQ